MKTQVVDLFDICHTQDLGLLWLMWVDRKPFPFFPTVLFPPEVAILITDLPGGGRTD